MGSAERREPVTRGTGNVFADLGFPDAAERQAKLRLAYTLGNARTGSGARRTRYSHIEERLPCQARIDREAKDSRVYPPLLQVTAVASPATNQIV